MKGERVGLNLVDGSGPHPGKPVGAPGALEERVEPVEPVEPLVLANPSTHLTPNTLTPTISHTVPHGSTQVTQLHPIHKRILLPTNP